MSTEVLIEIFEARKKIVSGSAESLAITEKFIEITSEGAFKRAHGIVPPA